VFWRLHSVKQSVGALWLTCAIVAVPRFGDAQGSDPERHEEVLFAGPVQVPAGKVYPLTFTTRANYRNARIAGSVQASGGAGNDIRVLVLKGQSVVYDSGRRRSVVLSVDFSEPGQYTLVFDNRFSLVSPKVVSGAISLVHWGVDVERTAADQQATALHYEQASRVLQRLFAALKSDESVWGTHQLFALPSIRLVNDRSFNAGAIWPANTIQVNKGVFALIDRAGEKGDDVLAALLAHELSHIFYRHSDRASMQGAKGFGDELRGVTALDRIQEKEADILGARLACQAGFDPQGIVILARTLAALDPTASNFMKNHPSGVERVNYLQAEAAKCHAVQTQQPRDKEPTTTESRLNPGAYKAKAPEMYRAKFTTTKGDFVVEVTRAWAPLGADRFYNLLKGGYYDGAPLYRVIRNFMAQFGFSPNPAVSKAWDSATIEDDPVRQSNKRGYITFATSGPNSRTTQVFINYRDNSALDGQGFAPFGLVVEGMDVVDTFYSGYGEGSDLGGHGPTQKNIASLGIAYVKENFPNLDTITSAEVVSPDGAHRSTRPKTATPQPSYLPDAFYASLTVLPKPTERVITKAWDKDPQSFFANSDDYVSHMFNRPKDIMWVSCLAGFRIDEAKSTTGSSVFPMDADDSKNAYWGVAVSDGARTNITILCIKGSPRM